MDVQGALQVLLRDTYGQVRSASSLADATLHVHFYIYASVHVRRWVRFALQGEERIAKLFDSPSMPEAECPFKITNGGIADTD